MVMVEFREAAYDKALDLIDESKKHNKETKLALCELEDVLSDMFEEHDDEDYEEEGESEIGLRHDESKSGMRYGMRSLSRRNMRMRRNRMGRYAY